MTKYKISLAILIGVGFGCLLCLLLGLSSWPTLSTIIGIFLAPGGIVTGLFVNESEFGLAVGLFTANLVIYSAITYVALSVLGRNLSLGTMRRVVIILVLPITMLLGLACIPRLNPLWPQAMADLDKEETNFQKALPLGMELDEARAVLNAKGIEFAESTEAARKLIFDDGQGTKIIASPGDQVIAARARTHASILFCDYRIQILLLFRNGERISQEYIHRMRLCP